MQPVSGSQPQPSECCASGLWRSSDGTCTWYVRQIMLITDKNLEIKKANQSTWAVRTLHFFLRKFVFSVSLPFWVGGLPKGCQKPKSVMLGSEGTLRKCACVTLHCVLFYVALNTHFGHFSPSCWSPLPPLTWPTETCFCSGATSVNWVTGQSPDCSWWVPEAPGKRQ